ncbi:MAG: type II toxin-antitoxin system HicA family toxin [Clostridiales bacterium]|nr:type II toxin-antitoxin system HicA family toxin [Clostridiales bacterium]
MSKKEKLIARLLSKPKDFTFAELEALLGCFEYKQVSLGKTSGSRVAFSNGQDYIRLHKPHPRNTLKAYQVEDIITALRERGLL